MASVPTADGGFDLGKFLQTVLGAGSSIYNATQSGNNAQQVAKTSDPFGPERPYYQGMLKDTLGHQANPYGNTFDATLASQTNPYEKQYEVASANQDDPYVAMIMKAIASRSNPYDTQLQSLLTNPDSFKADPGYQFALSQGQKAIERSSNALYGTARAGSLSPELAKYTEGYAAQNYDNRINQLSSRAGAVDSSNIANLGVLGSLSGQKQTTNTNQLAQLANLIGGRNSSNLGTLGALTSMYGTTGNINSNQIGQLLTASGATSGSPAAAGQAIGGGQLTQSRDIGAAIAAIPALAPYAAQIMQLIGGSGGGGGTPTAPGTNYPPPDDSTGGGVGGGINYPPPDDGTGGYGGGVNYPPPDDGTGYIQPDGLDLPW